MVGQSIGKYRIIDKIGRGGMGTVYRALDETLNRDVAIKVLNAELNDPEVARRFRAEAITIARLSHPGIATIYELFEFEGQWLMVMEFVRGETLENMVARMGPLSAQRAAELCMQTLTALAHAHSMGVVHRDLKPANIMITENGAVKVMDFGIARVTGSEHLTNAGFMMGTPAYMAPEQVRGGEVDARADLYAMGVVFYRLTTSKLPFKGDTAFSMVQSTVNDPPTPVHNIRPDLPNWVEEIVNRALAKAAEERFQSAVEFHEAFARCLAGLTLSSMYTQDGHLTPSRAMPSGAFSRPGHTPSMPYPMTGSQPTMRSPATNPGIVTAANDPTILTPIGSQTLPIDMRTAWPHTGAAAHSGSVPAPSSPPVARKKSNNSLWLGLAGLGIIVASIVAFVFTKGGPDSSATPSPSAEATPTPSPTPTEPPVVTSTDAGLAATPTLPSATSTPVVSPPASAAPSPSPTPSSSTSTTSTSVRPSPTPGPRGAGAPGSATGARGTTAQTPTPTPSPSPTPIAPASTHPASAVDEVLATFPNVKIYLVDGKRGVDRDLLLHFVGGQVQLVPKNGGAAIATMPYGKILRATYTLARDPKWDAGLPGPPVGLDVGGVFRQSRHWLVVQGADQYAVLRLEDGNFRQILATFEARTGLKIERIKEK